MFDDEVVSDHPHALTSTKRGESPPSASPCHASLLFAHLRQFHLYVFNLVIVFFVPNLGRYCRSREPACSVPLAIRGCSPTPLASVSAPVSPARFFNEGPLPPPCSRSTIAWFKSPQLSSTRCTEQRTVKGSTRKIPALVHRHAIRVLYTQTRASQQSQR